MARIEWAAACDHAFLDQHGRLCMIGVFRDVSAWRLPVALPPVTLVARLADVKSGDEVDVAVGMVTPSGHHVGRLGSADVRIERSQEYVLATFSNLVIGEEGLHHLQVRLRGQPIVALDVPVVRSAAPASIVQ